MGATIDDLASELEDYFSQQFPSDEDGGGPGSVLLVFDGLGTPLSPVEFIGSGAGAVT